MGSTGGYDFDLVTIGAGSGGTRASRFSAQQYGAKVAVIELPFGFVSSDTRGGAGGTCVIRGCVPKKLLVYGSSYSDEFKDSQGFGWTLNGVPTHDMENLIGRKAAEVTRLNTVYNMLIDKAGCTRYEGFGKILDTHTVEVQLASGGTKVLTTKYILVATGGQPVKAPIEGSEHALTSDDALTLQKTPKKMVIVGAGYISLEFAGIFAGYGSEVHLMYRAPLPLRGFDEECRAQVAENLQKKGIHVYASTKPVRIVKKAEDQFVVSFEGPETSGDLEVEAVMFGTGRCPNTKKLGLENVGVALNSHGAIKVNDYSQTNVENIYAIGDVTNRIDLTPVAIMEGMALAATLFGGKPTMPDYKYVASAVFTQPPLATVGYSEEEAKEFLEGEIDVYVSKFRPLKNTISGRDEKTIMKMLVKVDTDEVVGVHMVGPDAAEMMQGVAIALKAGAKKLHFDTTVGIHPTAAEELVSLRSRTRRIQGQGKSRPPKL